MKKLFYVVLGGTPEGRHIEQHDVFFGIAETFEDLIPEMKNFWHGVKIHADCWQELRYADGFEVIVKEKSAEKSDDKLFFINLGGYRPGVFGEFHEQHLMVGKTLGEVVKRAKQTEFYKTMGFEGAVSHIDDKHGVDIDDIFEISEVLPKMMKEKYSIFLQKSSEEHQENLTKIGYIKL